MKKKLFLFLVLLLGLSACNVPDPLPTATPTSPYTATPVPPTETPTLTPTPTNTPLPPALAVNESDLNGLNVLVRHAIFGSAADKLGELAEQFNLENPYGIHVNIERESEQEKLFVTGDGETPAALVIAENLKIRAEEANAFRGADLTDYINGEFSSFSAVNAAEIMPLMMEAEGNSEGIYSLPLWHQPSFLYYNKTWAQTLGFEETPRSFAEFAEQACAAGEANYKTEDLAMHGTGGWIVSSEPNSVMSWLINYGGLDGSAEKLFREGENGTFVQLAEWMRNLYDSGCAWTARITTPYDYFANRYAIFYSGTYADAERQLRAFEDANEVSLYDNWDLIPYPRRVSGGEPANPRVFSSAVSAILPARNLLTQYGAWMFLRWLYEGTHAAELSLSAGGWPVQDTDEITSLYRKSGKDKLYQTLSWRQYLSTSAVDRDWQTDSLILGDGFGYVFNPSARPEDIPQIWSQIVETASEVRDLR